MIVNHNLVNHHNFPINNNNDEDKINNLKMNTIGC